MVSLCERTATLKGPKRPKRPKVEIFSFKRQSLLTITNYSLLITNYFCPFCPFLKSRSLLTITHYSFPLIAPNETIATYKKNALDQTIERKVL